MKAEEGRKEGELSRGNVILFAEVKGKEGTGEEGQKTSESTTNAMRWGQKKLCNYHTHHSEI